MYISLVGCLSLTTGLLAQTTTSVTVDVPVLQRLQVTESGELPDFTTHNMDQGYVIIPNAVQLEISSNCDWQLIIRAFRENLYTTNVFKPISDFQWRLGNGAFTSLTMRPIKIVTGKAGTVRKLVSLDYQLELDWENTPPGEIEYAHEFVLEPITF